MFHGFKICTHLQGCWLPAVWAHLHMVQADGLGVISHWIPSSSYAAEKSRKYCIEIIARMFHCQWYLLLLTPSHPLCSLTLPILPGLCRIAPLSSICNRIVIHSLNSIHDYNMGCSPRTSGVRTRHTPCTLICHPSIFLPGSQNLGNYQSLHSETNTSHATMNANISSKWLVND